MQYPIRPEYSAFLRTFSIARHAEQAITRRNTRSSTERHIGALFAVLDQHEPAFGVRDIDASHQIHPQVMGGILKGFAEAALVARSDYVPAGSRGTKPLMYARLPLAEQVARSANILTGDILTLRLAEKAIAVDGIVITRAVEGIGRFYNTTSVYPEDMIGEIAAQEGIHAQTVVYRALTSMAQGTGVHRSVQDDLATMVRTYPKALDK